ncbi:MAG: aminotransferase class III-fold pyridoxal phosphate-dependent enzyme [Thermodesulfobacteriota bacterium]|nr:aminotransferase class III-fold pyridoxal phosphate-dependent enzyme [Thermodesulfobacteriota bacterium]
MTNHILATVNFEPNLLTKAQGSWVWDIDYNKYLDFVSGCWSVNLGHNHPKIVETIKEQASKLIHRSMWYLTDETVEAAKQLVKFVPHNHDKATFLSSGSEAVEFALNFAIKVSKKIKILSLKDGFYGSFGLGKEASYFSHKVSRLRIDYPRCNDLNCDCLDKYNSLIDLILRNYAKDLACFAIEPIMASGGILKPCSSFIDELCLVIDTDQLSKGLRRWVPAPFVNF